MSGEAKSKLKADSDILSLFLHNPGVFTEEAIVDELIDLLSASTAFTQIITQTVLAHFATDAESLERVRAEFDHVMRCWLALFVGGLHG